MASRVSDAFWHGLRDDPRPWDQIPVAVLTGAVIGIMVIWIAIRFMIRKK
jgi:hypothetical protein